MTNTTVDDSYTRKSPLVNFALLRKSIADASLLLAGCTLALSVICAVRVWIVSKIDTSRFKQLVDLIPSEVLSFIPVDYEWMLTYIGRLALTYEEPIVFLVMAVWCISRGSDCVSGEVGRGTMEMLLAQPVSRRQVVLSQMFVTFSGVFLIALASWVSMAICIQYVEVKETVQLKYSLPNLPIQVPIPFTERTIVKSLSGEVTVVSLLAGMVNFLLIGLVLAAITVLVSTIDRYRWRTIGIMVTFYILQILAVIAATAAEGFQWMNYLTIFSIFEPSQMIYLADQEPEKLLHLFLYDEETGAAVGLGPVFTHGWLVFLTILCLVSATMIFRRRDLPAPI